MAFQRQVIPQPDLVRWVDTDNPGVVGYLEQDNTVIVIEPFISIKRIHVRKLIAALTALANWADSNHPM